MSQLDQFDGYNQQLMKKSGIKDIDRMDGYQFEEYPKVLFKTLGYRPIVTKKSGDFGTDVVLKGRNKMVIQAKRYIYKHNVSLNAVREVFTDKYYYKADEACDVKILNRYELEKFIVRINPERSPKEVLNGKRLVK